MRYFQLSLRLDDGRHFSRSEKCAPRMICRETSVGSRNVISNELDIVFVESVSPSFREARSNFSCRDRDAKGPCREVLTNSHLHELRKKRGTHARTRCVRI